MSTFDESEHPRGVAGRFAQKQNAAPTSALTAERVEFAGHYTSDARVAEAAADGRGAREITAAEHEAREVADARDLRAGDALVLRSMTDTVERYWAEEVTHVTHGVDDRYRRVTVVESRTSSWTFRASEPVAIQRRGAQAD